MKRGVLIIFVAILIPCLLQAQTTPNDPQRLTLEQAVNFAVEHNKELQASQMNARSLTRRFLQQTASPT